MKNSKSIRVFAAFLILIYHLWINLFPGNIVENYLHFISYVGVDIFFFMSGFALSKREIGSYKEFVISRFAAVYVRYIIFAVIAFFWSGWSMQRLLQVISGVELVRKGGGSFLWFLPAIMFFYLIFPFFYNAHKKQPVMAYLIAILVWLLVGIILKAAFDYKAGFIAINRLPVFITGFYIGKHSTDFLQKDKNRLFLGILCTCVGLVLLYYLGFRNRLQFPVPDMFYALSIFAAIGLTMLCSFIPENSVILILSRATLEMYGIQMIFGYQLANVIFKATKSGLFTNFTVIVIISVTSVLFQKAYTLLKNKFLLFWGFR